MPRPAALWAFIAIRALDELGGQMLNVAVSWYVYAATHSPLSLAWVGLARFLPNFGMVLIAGHAVDRYDRRTIVGLSLFIQAVCLAVFCIWTTSGTPAVKPVYGLLVLIGAAQALLFPAMSATLSRVVSSEELPRAVAKASSVVQVCALAGPAIGGLIYAVSGPGTFAIASALYFVGLLLVRNLGEIRVVQPTADVNPFGGIRYIRTNRLLLGTISLDLFAVLLGGITALLPIYAKDILALGPAGLGWLRCAPGIGAAIVGFALARSSVGGGSGRLMLICVAGFGVATVVFALSTSFWLSIFALTAVGGFDMVSMVIRQTLVQMTTPDAMRGRVSAVQGVFIGASNELGEFESGLTAALFGTVPAALLGGLGTLVIVAIWSRIFPELLRTDKVVT